MKILKEKTPGMSTTALDLTLFRSVVAHILRNSGRLVFTFALKQRQQKNTGAAYCFYSQQNAPPQR